MLWGNRLIKKNVLLDVKSWLVVKHLLKSNLCRRLYFFKFIYALKKRKAVHSKMYDSDCRQSRLQNEVLATDFSVLDYAAANPNEKELNRVPIIPFLCSIFASFFKFRQA